LFPRQANGSLITDGERIAGSTLLGQNFVDPKYFWSRPSATTPFPYNAAASSGSNLGPLNPDLTRNIEARRAALRAADPEQRSSVPLDLLTSSASGLDPHISPDAAEYQAARVARARGLTVDQIRESIRRNTSGRQWGFLGEPVVNVVSLNLTLDRKP
jgi:K+-transporting ATPase ATPase C chain